MTAEKGALRLPAEVPPIGRGEVHVWTLPLGDFRDGLAALEACMAEAERSRATRFRFDADRHRYIVGRGCARALIARYLANDDPAGIELEDGAHGKPLLPAAPLHFNWSHSGDVIALAFTLDAEVGVDVERLHRATDLDQVAERVFSPSELDAYRALQGEPRREAFFNGWTRKEAFIKATGEGLTRPLREFDVELRPGESPRLLSIAGDPAAAKAWTLHSFVPQAGYMGAVAVNAPGIRLRRLGWR